jgi:DNA (cytosine-5)-methyltransferase 1
MFIEVPYTMQTVNDLSSQHLFNVVSLFAGAGGSSTGYRLAGGKVLAINEFMPKARESYRKNYADTHIFEQDVRKLTGEMILNQIQMNKGDLDILDGSPPCCSFSMAGNREKDWGKEKQYSAGTQRTDDLFYEYARIVEEVQPKVFIAENVKGITLGSAKDLLGSAQLDLFGAHKHTIYHTLCDAGYKVQYKVLNSKDYGVAQARERTIFIGVRQDLNIQPSHPKCIVNRYRTVSDVLSTVVNTDADIAEARVKEDSVSMRLLRKCRQGESFDIYHEKNAMFSHIRLDPDKCAPTLMQTKDKYHYSEDRFLTIPEMKRLQSFPDDYYLSGNHGNKWERIGRSVPPLMMKAIAEHVYNKVLKVSAEQ